MSPGISPPWFSPSQSVGHIGSKQVKLDSVIHTSYYITSAQNLKQIYQKCQGTFSAPFNITISQFTNQIQTNEHAKH